MSIWLLGVASSYSGLLAFVGGLLLLVVGYTTYGRFVEGILGPDDRITPAVKYNDGVDYIVLPHWKNMLIQLLNIAGIGPVIGVIAGIKFGSIVFILIPIGNLIAGATHDFISGMASLRNKGGNLPSFVQKTLGKVYYGFFSVFMIFLLLLVVAVFINVPAKLIDITFVPQYSFFWGAVGLIFIYYIVATLFPIDKIIGHFYPIFGAVLLFGSLALLVSLLCRAFCDPSILLESEAFSSARKQFLGNNPLIPCVFVTIACGIISGFHATQSPIIARTMNSERNARASFYGMMVVEGVIAMVWAGAALVVYNLYLGENPDFWAKSANDVLPIITKVFLGNGLGTITVLAVVVLAITSGDTAMRSIRLSLAEMFKLDQKVVRNRIGLCLPLIAIISLLLLWSNKSAASFGKLWTYFAWGNQVIAASTLGAGTVWIFSRKKNGWIAVIPALFMSFIVVSFILWTSPKHGGPQGLGLGLNVAYVIGSIVSVLFVSWCVFLGIKFARTKGDVLGDDSQDLPEIKQDNESQK